MAVRGAAIPQAKYKKNDSGFVRVKKNRPCQICGKTDWCTYSGDGQLAFCMRQSAGSLKQLSNAAYLHVVDPGAVSVQPVRVKPKVAKSVDVDPQVTHEVYSFLLRRCLVLEDEHFEHLLNERSLRDVTVAGKLYASVPEKDIQDAISRCLADKFGKRLNGVPGFYIDEASGEWKFKFPSDGFIIPIRNFDDLIVGLMVRRDGNGKPKYLWISTPRDEYVGGNSSGAPVHFARPELIKHTRRVIITEGALKADCIAELSGESCIGIAGISAFTDSFATELKWKTHLRLQEVIIAFDMDWKTNPSVRRAVLKLMEQMVEAGFSVGVRTWDIANGKGYDDYLRWEQEIPF